MQGSYLRATAKASIANAYFPGTILASSSQALAITISG